MSPGASAQPSNVQCANNHSGTSDRRGTRGSIKHRGVARGCACWRGGSAFGVGAIAAGEWLGFAAGAMGRCGAKVQRALQKLQQGIVSGLHVHHGRDHNAGVPRGDDEQEEKVPSDVPAGFLVVYVGEERRRFVIKAKILKHETFRVLLEKSAEEFGYKHDGGLIIACDVAFFQHLVQLIETKSPSLCRMQLRDYWAFAPDNSTYRMVD